MTEFMVNQQSFSHKIDSMNINLLNPARIMMIMFTFHVTGMVFLFARSHNLIDKLWLAKLIVVN